MKDEMSKQLSTPSQVEGTAQCGPGCNCGRPGLGKKEKMAICLIVIAAAMLVLGRGLAQRAANKTAKGPATFTVTIPQTIPASSATDEKTKALLINEAKSVLWGRSLKDFASLNQVAAKQDAVFVYLPEKRPGPIDSVKQQVAEAAGKAQAGGTKMACYVLDTNSPDYAKVTRRVPPPFVLAVVKGGGTGVVSGQITQERLLQAVVTASRPSSCGSSDCSSGCN